MWLRWWRSNGKCNFVCHLACTDLFNFSKKNVATMVSGIDNSHNLQERAECASVTKRFIFHHEQHCCGAAFVSCSQKAKRHTACAKKWHKKMKIAVTCHWTLQCQIDLMSKTNVNNDVFTDHHLFDIEVLPVLRHTQNQTLLSHFCCMPIAPKAKLQKLEASKICCWMKLLQTRETRRRSQSNGVTHNGN